MTFGAIRAGSGASGTGPGPAAPPRLTAEEAAIIVESAPDAILVVDGDGTIRYANAEAASMFGYPRAELVDMAVDRLLPGHRATGHAQLRAEFARYPRTRPMGTGRQLAARRSDASEFPAEVSLLPMPSASDSASGTGTGTGTGSGAGTGVRPATVAVIRDITERLAAEEAGRALLIADRERVAAELGDHVVRRLFRAGITVQSVLKLTDGTVRERLDEAVQELDAAVVDVRSVAFGESASGHST